MTKELTLLRDEGGQIIVRDPGSYEVAAGFLLKAKQKIREAEAYWDPEIKRAREQHLALCGKRDDMKRPLESLVHDLDNRMKVWRVNERERQRKAELEAQAEATKRAEAERKDEAKLLKKAGRADEAQALLEKPIEAPLVILPTEIPKVKGLSHRFVYKWRLKDSSKLHQGYLIPDEPSIGATVRKMGKRAEAVVGAGAIEVYEEEISAGRAK